VGGEHASEERSNGRTNFNGEDPTGSNCETLSPGEKMPFIYATGEPGQFDFYVTQTRSSIPSGARVFAPSTGEAIAEMLGERTLYAMTDGEFYELQALLRQVRELEARRMRSRTGVLDSIWSWLVRQLSTKTVSQQTIRSFTT
jgi:hypothetical protein